ncbi:hypothetical protein J5Y04_05475 [Kitasatospora sp. RG8]|nr:hypothetical protein [Kitasatospora sp. RG8]
MGGSTWEYLTPYRGSMEATLEALHEEVFQELYGDGAMFGSRAELYADEQYMAEAGTHSILDVRHVVATTEPPGGAGGADYGTLRPLAPERLVHHFGTERPTVEQYEAATARAHEALLRWTPGPDTTLHGEHTMRWTGRYVLLHTDGRPTHVGIFGSSGD